MGGFNSSGKRFIVKARNVLKDFYCSLFVDINGINMDHDQRHSAIIGFSRSPLHCDKTVGRSINANHNRLPCPFSSSLAHDSPLPWIGFSLHCTEPVLSKTIMMMALQAIDQQE